MTNLLEGVKLVTEQIAKERLDLEDHAVSQYIKSQAEYLLSKGESLTDYSLVRDAGYLATEGGDKFVGNVRYGLVKTADIVNVRFEDD